MAAGAQGHRRGQAEMGHKGIFYILIMVIDTLLCACVKICLIIQLKLVTLIECKLYLNKAA